MHRKSAHPWGQRPWELTGCRGGKWTGSLWRPRPQVGCAWGCRRSCCTSTGTLWPQASCSQAERELWFPRVGAAENLAPGRLRGYTGTASGAVGRGRLSKMSSYPYFLTLALVPAGYRRKTLPPGMFFQHLLLGKLGVVATLKG